MLVSTLDGRVTALDVENKGSIAWEIQADPRPLLSSSISKLEVCFSVYGITVCKLSLKQIHMVLKMPLRVL